MTGDIASPLAGNDSATVITRRMAELGEWLTGFTLNGERFGGQYFAESDFRVLAFLERLKARAAPPAAIMECGCFEGGHTTVLAQALPQTRILGVDVRTENLTKARLLAELKGCPNIDFSQDDFDAPKTCFARQYDAIFCVGLLYHLRWPKVFLERACQAAPLLWLWTVYCSETEATVGEGDFRGRIYNEPTAHPLSGVRDESYFPTLGSLLDMLWLAGYSHIELVRKEMTANGNGPAILLFASR